MGAPYAATMSPAVAARRRPVHLERLVHPGFVTATGRRGRARDRWMIEELRVSLFAQRLGTRGRVYEPRILRAIAGAGAGAGVRGTAG